MIKYDDYDSSRMNYHKEKRRIYSGSCEPLVKKKNDKI
jgi:hypothetical protein